MLIIRTYFGDISITETWANLGNCPSSDGRWLEAMDLCILSQLKKFQISKSYRKNLNLAKSKV